VQYPNAIQNLMTEGAFENYTLETTGNSEALANLQALTVDSIFDPSLPSDSPDSSDPPSGHLGNPAGRGVTGQTGHQGNSGEMAKACLSGLWLLHNFLDRSHDISQSLPSPVGSHWHAIMHRMEGDFSNSKYWYRRVGDCPVYQSVSDQIGEPFDPFAFVDQVESQGSHATRLTAVAEWRSLFAFCFSGANIS
jgi:hypothetical protein